MVPRIFSQYMGAKSSSQGFGDNLSEQSGSSVIDIDVMVDGVTEQTTKSSVQPMNKKTFVSIDPSLFIGSR